MDMDNFLPTSSTHWLSGIALNSFIFQKRKRISKDQADVGMVEANEVNKQGNDCIR